MAKKKDKDAMAITRLTPNALVVLVDGEELRVPTTKAENTVMNQIVASQARNLVQRQLKNYKDDEAKMTPKELADIVRSIRDLTSMTTEVYAVAEGIDIPKEKAVEKDDDDLDFSKLGKVTEVKEEEKPDGSTT